MAVKQPAQNIAESGEEGQSVLEFLMMLPMMLALVTILIKVNTAIQVSINSQQYARAQALWLTFSSPYYPQYKLKIPQLVEKKYSQMVIGVSSNKAEGGDYVPKAAVYYIARKKGAPEGESKSEPAQRTSVRVRNTVTLCTMPNVIHGAGGLIPVVPLKLNGTTNGVTAMGPYNLGENPQQFEFCGTPMKYVSGESES